MQELEITSEASSRYSKASFHSSGGCALQEALLIRAQSRVVQLESEVCRLRQEIATNQVKDDFNASKDISVSDVERLHKLEQERCDVVEELAAMKRKLSEAEAMQRECNDKYQLQLEHYHIENQTLKAQVENLMIQMNELDTLNDEMHSELNEVQLLNPEHQLEQVEELKQDFTKSVQVLRRRVAELEDVESKLVTSQAEVKQLQHQLRMYRQDHHFIGSMRDTAICHERLQHQVQKLTEENASLREDRANADLLRYQVQNLEQRYEEVKGAVEEVARLKVENQRLQTGGASGNEGALSALQIRLAELQQKEIVALSNYGELASQLKVSQQELSQCRVLVEETQKKLALEKASVAAGNERINKLERRLIFVTKERDGCVNVLNSYKSDSGVDGLMRELLAEKEQEIERSKERISELESALAVLEDSNNLP